MATKKEKIAKVLKELGFEDIKSDDYLEALEALLARGLTFKFAASEGEVYLLIPGKLARQVEKKTTLKKLMEALVNELY